MAEEEKPHVREGRAESDIVEGKVSNKGILLRPQPTNDPNEPLVSVHANHYNIKSESQSFLELVSG